MMIPKRELMARLRRDRIKNGLIELRIWVTPEQKEKVINYLVRAGIIERREK